MKLPSAVAGAAILAAVLLLSQATPSLAQIRTGQVRSAGGIIPCNEDGGPGTMTFDTDFEATGGYLEIHIEDRPGGCAHSVLRVTRTARLGGDVRLTLVFRDGYEPRLGDTYDVLVVGSLLGGFHDVESPGLPPGLALRVESLDDRVRVVVVPADPTVRADPQDPAAS